MLYIVAGFWVIFDADKFEGKFDDTFAVRDGDFVYPYGVGKYNS